jgi:hypothetical protein
MSYTLDCFQAFYLQEILNSHNGVDFAPNTGPRTVNTAVTAIVKAKIVVDWKFILDTASDKKSLHEVNNIMQEYFRAKRIVEPVGLFNSDHTSFLNGCRLGLSHSTQKLLLIKSVSHVTAPNMSLTGCTPRNILVL